MSSGPFSPAPAALIGIAVDVSGSMQSSIHNRQAQGLSRFRAFHDALAHVISASQVSARDLADTAAAGVPEALVFAYAFGLRTAPEVVDLLSLLTLAQDIATPAEIEQMKERYAAQLRQRYAGAGKWAGLARSYGFGNVVDQAAASVRASAENEVREKIKNEIMTRVRASMNETAPATLTLTELARLWGSAGSGSFEQAEPFIYGSTPMRQCLEQVADRFALEQRRLPAGVPKFLVLISDGEPTDGDPLPALGRIKSLGVFVASCLLTDDDVVEPRRLYSAPQPEWKRAARLMFEAASPVEEDELYREFLEGRGWTVADRARLFTQINHSELIGEFLSLAFSRASGKPM